MCNQPMTLRKTMLLLMVTAALTSGCLQEEKQHRFYLEPDGAVTWTVIEHDIHAVSGTPESRQREEEEFLDLARGSRHAVAVGFAALGAPDVRVRIVRSEWPYMVVTEARFPSLGRLWEEALRAAGIRGDSRLERAGDLTTWTLVVFDDEDQKPPDEGVAQAVNDLLDPGKDLQFFIRHGEFVEAQGFDISDDNRAATLKESALREGEDEQGSLTLRLSWRSSERPAAPGPKR